MRDRPLFATATKTAAKNGWMGLETDDYPAVQSPDKSRNLYLAFSQAPNPLEAAASPEVYRLADSIVGPDKVPGLVLGLAVDEGQDYFLMWLPEGVSDITMSKLGMKSCIEALVADQDEKTRRSVVASHLKAASRAYITGTPIRQLRERRPPAKYNSPVTPDGKKRAAAESYAKWCGCAEGCRKKISTGSSGKTQARDQGQEEEQAIPSADTASRQA